MFAQRKPPSKSSIPRRSQNHSIGRSYATLLHVQRLLLVLSYKIGVASHFRGAEFAICLFLWTLQIWIHCLQMSRKAFFCQITVISFNTYTSGSHNDRYMPMLKDQLLTTHYQYVFIKKHYSWKKQWRIEGVGRENERMYCVASNFLVQSRFWHLPTKNPRGSKIHMMSLVRPFEYHHEGSWPDTGHFSQEVPFRNLVGQLCNHSSSSYLMQYLYVNVLAFLMRNHSNFIPW